MLYLIENSVLCSVHIWKNSLGLTWEQMCICFAGKQTFSFPNRRMHFNITCMWYNTPIQLNFSKLQPVQVVVDTECLGIYSAHQNPMVVKFWIEL